MSSVVVLGKFFVPWSYSSLSCETAKLWHVQMGCWEGYSSESHL